MRNIYISIILTTLFWSVMFIVTPYDDLRNERDIKIEKQERIKTLSVQEKVQEFLKDYNEPRKTNYLIIAIYAYLLIQFILTFFNKHLSEWKIFNLSFLIGIIGFFLAFVYYFKTRYLYDYETNGLRDYGFIFTLVSSIPVTLIAYQIVRLVYSHLFNLNPRIVGKVEFFTEPSNWLFSVLVFVSGMIVTIYVDLIGITEKLINHFA